MEEKEKMRETMTVTRSLRAVALSIVLLLPAAALAGQNWSYEGLLDYMEQIRNDNDLPGLSVAVAVDGEIVFSEGVGVAELDNRTRATGRTVHNVGSVSKVLAVVGLMQLVEQGEGGPRRHAPNPHALVSGEGTPDHGAPHPHAHLRDPALQRGRVRPPRPAQPQALRHVRGGDGAVARRPARLRHGVRLDVLFTRAQPAARDRRGRVGDGLRGIPQALRVGASGHVRDPVRCPVAGGAEPRPRLRAR